MDKVLTRKLFRDKYLKTIEPKGIASIKKYQVGGEVIEETETETVSTNQGFGFTPKQERALLGMTLAGALLQGTQRPGESVLKGTLRAAGAGLSALPDTAIKLAKARPKIAKVKGIREATDSEKQSFGYSPKDRLLVKTENGVAVGIADKPTAGERKDAANRDTVINTAKDIKFLLKELDDPTGPIGGNLIKLKGALGNEYMAELNIKTQDIKKSVIQALRGAAVGVAEENTFKELLPSIYDRPTTINTKVDVIIDKLERINNRLSPTTGQVDRRLSKRELAEEYGDVYKKLGINPTVFMDNKLDTYKFNADGGLEKR